MTNTTQNIKKNRAHYNKRYAQVNIQSILNKLEHLDDFLSDTTTTDTSWVCMYMDGFATQLKGKKVLELGCGDCTNASVMAALGAEVWANDISEKSGDVIAQVNEATPFNYPIHFVSGNFLDTEIPDNTFDIVVGKAFVHHLTHQQETQFLEKIVKLLKPDGIVRFVEPAVNSKVLDILRWMVPVSGRPSSLQRSKFKEWLETDPHPIRENSGKHYKSIGLRYFKEVTVVPIGALERFHRLFPKARWNRKFRRLAFKIEGYMPGFLKYPLARTQTINYWFPLKHDVEQK